MGLTKATDGRLLFEAIDLAQLPVERRPAALLRQLQMVFQNPDETLNPSYSVGTQLARAVCTLGVTQGRAGVHARVRSLLKPDALAGFLRQPSAEPVVRWTEAARRYCPSLCWRSQACGG